VYLKKIPVSVVSHILSWFSFGHSCDSGGDSNSESDVEESEIYTSKI
jgi:hypothetical protein